MPLPLIPALYATAHLCRVVHNEYGGHHRAQGHVITQYVPVVRDAILVDAIWYEEQYQGGEGAMKHAIDELAYVEQFALQARRIESRILHAVLVRYVLLEDAQRQHRQRCVEQIVDRYEHRIEYGLEQ